jgi:8-oxo-dGTP pyrophosphatase MutT (NUDIX family)
MSPSQTSSGGVFQQVGVIAVRSEREHLQVCLIRKKDSESWGIPKGFVDPGDTPEEAAVNEAEEEAGLKGQLLGPSIGTYHYQKWKWGGRLIVAVYVLHVTEEQPNWPEMWRWERRWLMFKEAERHLKGHPVCPLLEDAITHFNNRGLNE